MNTLNKNQFIELIEQHKGIIFKVANSYCAKHQDKQDLAQEIITTIWTSFNKFNDQYKFSTWMYRVALNVAISYYRKDKKHHKNVSIEDNCILNIVDINEHDDDEINQLYQLINQLDKVNKAIMLLYLEDESYSEIALTLGITKTNVATRISRIKTLLKQKLVEPEL